MGNILFSEFFKQMKDLRSDMNKQFDSMQTNIDSIKDDLSSVKDDMNKQFVSMQTNIDERFVSMQTNIDSIKDDLSSVKDDLSSVKISLDNYLVPSGDIFAKIFTVKISLRTTTKDIYNGIGHGFLMKQHDEYYIVSAAHVCVGALYYYPLSKEINIQLTWIDVRTNSHSFGESSIDVTATKFYIPKTYIENGKNDIGCMLINNPMGPNAFASNEHFGQLACMNTNQNIVGTTAIGHGDIFIRGTILCVKEQRLLLHAKVSIPGCSGLPLFDNQHNILGIVHGNSIHHRGMSGHTTDHSSNDITNRVYADTINSSIKLYEIDECNYTKLIAANDVPQDVANNPETTLDILLNGLSNDEQILCNNMIEKLNFDTSKSLNENMQNMANEITNDCKSITITTPHDTQIVRLF